MRSLKKRADGVNLLDALAAQRLLELAFVNAAYYEQRGYINARDFGRALGMLEIAN